MQLNCVSSCGLLSRREFGPSASTRPTAVWEPAQTRVLAQPRRAVHSAAVSSHQEQLAHVSQVSGSQREKFMAAGPLSLPADYADVDAAPLNALALGLFRRKMVEHLGEDTDKGG